MVSVDPSLARCSAPDFTASASARASGSSRLASIAMVPSKDTCWVSKVTCRLSADLSSAFSTSSGMNRTRASSTSRPNAAGVNRDAHQNTCSSTYVAASRVRARVVCAINRARHPATSPACTAAHSRGRR